MSYKANFSQRDQIGLEDHQKKKNNNNNNNNNNNKIK